MTTDSPVRDQYETYPYPPRDPARELERLHTTMLSQLRLANHALWGGCRTAGPGFRVLDAGCGTGDNTVFAAHQLRDSGAEVVGLDLSEASLSVTRARLQARGLDKTVTLARGRIEEIASLGLGTFDYILSAGVLHHLPSPEAGLAALVSVLRPQGGLGLMVYGRYGRTAIYQLQELFRLLAPASLPAAERVRRARLVLSRLGAEHWASLARGAWEGEIQEYGDAGLFDLFLHSTDRAYTVPELHQWLAGAGLRLVRFDMPVLYQPGTYGESSEHFAHLSPVERQTAAELLNGHMRKHTFHAVRQADPPPEVPAPGDERAIPTWLHADTTGGIRKQLESGQSLSLNYEGIAYQQDLAPAPRALLLAVDGRRTLGEILDEVQARFPAESRASLLTSWLQLVEATAILSLLGMFPPHV
jgi:2-polyprenyl-3-methyl-5-hydroxy-6-metoxy-1,4-benzoquinol methylase